MIVAKSVYKMLIGNHFNDIHDLVLISVCNVLVRVKWTAKVEWMHAGAFPNVHHTFNIIEIN